MALRCCCHAEVHVALLTSFSCPFSEPNLLVRACNQLGQFLQHRETNLRYLALESMCTLASSEFSHEAVKTHMETVINALKASALRSGPRITLGARPVGAGQAAALGHGSPWHCRAVAQALLCPTCEAAPVGCSPGTASPACQGRTDPCLQRQGSSFC